jgi:hypothetical protein
VRAFLTERGVYPLNEMIWLKRDFSFMDRKQVA